MSSLHWTHWTDPLDDPLDIDNHWRFIGATQVQGDGGPWTLAIEFNGWIGDSDEYMSPASAGTQVLSQLPERQRKDVLQLVGGRRTPDNVRISHNRRIAGQLLLHVRILRRASRRVPQ
ncbi:DUF6461 domain-containing protein [Streptomyces niveus]|uniref:DUF6461 domain-containing protein n=1 Tax=Streptomyces niveus TaxID=193462 RepID=UPI003420986C